ncbi:sugar ABC transporter ATP-binding protein [Thermosediminibacter litoriperuensis]|uniref:Monosaccharide ABC transporter ATP-binding protein, CUT2 family (TC 3.A.1.2.-) n=1 Tax=Thermosediminibacter litoriperuensis TaxID=291989 RepID=A0A5S5ANY6_9FIRM|nr:sugar ABC transporter ATP-binding protein [Thermosediminibacter litoriperuensis]TYP53339.1 monosaccharide ABC transporter ATP-binding protein, CUT2 family (TC 3.A.1.2.-) [Thermosediminibacter litoriperuensis]
MDYILEMRNISKDFPGIRALNRVNLYIKPGEVHVLVGENGAGKSTLMKILTGVYSKDEGEIIFKGEKIDIKNPKEAQNIGISIIYQELNLVPQLSIAENIFLGREPLNGNGLIDWKNMYKNTEELLKRLNLNLDPRVKVKNLGIAQQQMIEIAKALSFKSELIIMDEPTSALAEKEIEQLFKVINQLKNSGVSIIYISHRLEEIKKIGDRLTVLRDGTYIGTYEVNSLNLDKIIQLMVGRKIEEKFPKEIATISEKVLEVKNINRGGILKNISFCLRKGEVLGLFGLMGAGRTELARAIFGADPIDSGEIYINGVKVNINSPLEAIKHGIGLLPEDRKMQGLIQIMSITSNITLPSLNNFIKRFFINKKLEKCTTAEYIKKLNIKTPSPLREVRYLSGGNQQKVVLAKWLCANVQVLIFDEPTRGIDVGAKVEIYKLINQLVREGKAVLLISSELPEILGMSDRILVMHEGEITGELLRQDASEEKILAYAMGRLKKVG